MGKADRIIRVLLVISIAILFFTNVVTGTLGWLLLFGAGVLLVTILAGYCPLYSLFGIRTCRK